MTGGGMADKTISLRYPAAGTYSVMFTIEDNTTHCVSHASQAVTVNQTYNVNDYRSKEGTVLYADVTGRIGTILNLSRL